MSNLPAFQAYAVTTVLLALNLFGTWGFSGGTRVKSRMVQNPEDLSSVAKGAVLAEQNHESVARILRAHANADANVVPFLFLGLLFVAAGGGSTEGWVLFGAFTALRYAHTFTYINGLQPWRTVSFAAGMLVAGVLAVRVFMLAVM